MANGNKVILIIMDGWGEGPNPKVSAIAQANTPFVDSLYIKYPNAKLLTYGENVGLPAGQMGNSEVGHLNIGAGRVVYQELLRINKAVESRDLHQNDTVLTAINHAKTNGTALHLMGLVSDGGVHSHLNHIKALCDIANENGLSEVYIHAFTDGRDTDPKGGLGYVSELEKHLENSAGQVATVIGRYYAMDRDQRWERIKLAYDMLVEGKGKPVNNIQEGIRQSYDNNETDEFIKPIVKTDANGDPIATIRENDAVICFNFRTDRCRQITVALTQKDMPEHAMQTIPLHYVTMTKYDSSFEGIHIIFRKDELQNTLGEVLETAGKKQIRIAETEKYAHVTYFFNGGREATFEGEERIMIQSPKVATYDLQPEMSAGEVTEAIVKEIKKGEVDFICLNFANADMVGHTGVFEAGVKAAEAVDNAVKMVVEAGLGNAYTYLITADHGNADFMINKDGSPNTAHTKYPVPFFVVSENYKGAVNNGKLGDIAPTILTIMGLEVPPEMTGEVLTPV